MEMKIRFKPHIKDIEKAVDGLNGALVAVLGALAGDAARKKN